MTTATLILLLIIIQVNSYIIKFNRETIRFLKKLNLVDDQSVNDDDNNNVQLKRISKVIETWSGCHGLLYADAQLKNHRNELDNKYIWRTAPLSLLPLPYPYKAYQYAKDLQPTINILIDKVSRDRDFLINTLNIIARTDEFTNNLLQIYEEVDENVIKDSVQLGLHRSDYMLNADNNNDGNEKPLQIEMNTIASSFGCLSEKVTTLHKYILEILDKDTIAWDTVTKKINYPFNDSSAVLKAVPDNVSTRMLAFGIAMAHLVFGNSKSIALFVVQPGERNVADQRLLAQELWTSHNIRTEFITLSDVVSQCYVDDSKILKYKIDNDVNHDLIISVVYYRAGYSPSDYPTSNEWKARKMIEFSSAIKCPSVGYQLAGTKKVQQVLCEKNILEKYLNPHQCELLRECFAAQYSLGTMATKESLEAVDSAIKDGSKWVLKPQREGGGNNLYGDDLSNYLNKHKGDKVLSEYILMQRIFPKVMNTFFLRNSEIKLLPSINELGIYGTFLGDGSSKPLINTYSGFLLRTKPSGVDEGGVATGYSVLNSIALLDIEEPNIVYEKDEEEEELELERNSKL